MRKRKNREPLSGELNNAHASRYWTQFTSAHCATSSNSRMESNGASTAPRARLIADCKRTDLRSAHPYRKEELESEIEVPTPRNDTMWSRHVDIEVQDAANQQDPIEHV
jgi:hypothetical protein